MEICFSPGINYLLAPNGHGKSTVLLAVMLAFGSRSPELRRSGESEHNDNILIGEDAAEIELFYAK